LNPSASIQVTFWQNDENDSNNLDFVLHLLLAIGYTLGFVKLNGALVMSDVGPKLVHMHIPKTAGTALRKAIERSRQNRRIFPHYDERKYVNINVDDYDFFSGHIGYKTASRLGGEIVCLLRHPVDRFVSVYYFWRSLYEKNIENSVNTRLASKYKLDDFVGIREIPSLIEEFYNRMTFQIAYGSMLEHRLALREDGRTDDDIFTMAVENAKKLSVVGVQENITKFSEKLSRKYGLHLDVRQENVTEKRSATFELSTSTISKMQQWVSMDLELFELVRRMD
jgi:hypothetical protein